LQKGVGVVIRKIGASRLYKGKEVQAATHPRFNKVGQCARAFIHGLIQPLDRPQEPVGHKRTTPILKIQWNHQLLYAPID
jgi:hypothetical protein